MVYEVNHYNSGETWNIVCVKEAYGVSMLGGLELKHARRCLGTTLPRNVTRM